MGVDHSTVGGYGFKLDPHTVDAYLVSIGYDDGENEYFETIFWDQEPLLRHVQAGSYYGPDRPIGAIVAKSTLVHDDDGLTGWTDEFKTSPTKKELKALKRWRELIYGPENQPKMQSLIGGLWH